MRIKKEGMFDGTCLFYLYFFVFCKLYQVILAFLEAPFEIVFSTVYIDGTTGASDDLTS